MPKKIEKKLKKKVAVKSKVEKPKVVKLKIEEPKEEAKAGSVPEPALPPPQDEPIAQPVIEVLPEGVLKKEVVDINGRKYNKFWYKDGTAKLEPLG